MDLPCEFPKYIDALNEKSNCIINTYPNNDDYDNNYLDEPFYTLEELFHKERPIDTDKLNKNRISNPFDSTYESINKEYFDFSYPTFYQLPLNFPKKNMFDLKYYRKRGRVSNDKEHDKDKSFIKKKHMRTDFDNIQTKIQVHFTNFLIDLTNDVVYTEFNCKDKFFKPISYQVKKQIKSDYIKNIFQEPIKNIIQEDISLKFKNFKPDYNKCLCEELSKRSKWFSDFLELKYIDVFNKYYFNNEKPLESVEFNERKICVSKKTKSYYYLLNKEKVLEKEIKNLVEVVYLSPYKNKTFIISKNDN